jgi:hypothetical protein
MTLWKTAAGSCGLRVVPQTQPPGGVFTVARLGRFALVSATVPKAEMDGFCRRDD